MPDNKQVSWPGWEVVRVIGNGSFGSVYEIQRNTFGNIESAALKVISIPQSRSDIEELYNDGYDDASITARFNSYLEDIVKEYSLMVDMKGHTNVVYCDDFRYVQHDDGIGWDIYIKMELLTPLTKVLGKEITEEQTVQLGIDMCNALVLCKSRNIVHRDIKPQNIFVSKDGNFKLGDFGIAKTAERTTSGTKVGTYKYMAPEVYNNQPYGAGADIYSLGLVLYWMLNERRTPFLPLPPQVPTASLEDEARRKRFSGERIPAPLHGSEELKRIVLKACAYDPKERYTAAADMLADLRALQKGDLAAIGAMTTVVGAVTTDVAEDPTEKVTADATEGTVNIFSARGAKETYDSDRTEYIPRDVKKKDPVVAAPPVQQDTPKPKKKGIGRWIALFGGILAVVALVLLLLHSCGDQPAMPTDDPDTTTIQTDPTETTVQTDPTEESIEPPETTLPAAVTHKVPDVKGMTEAQAKATLETLNFVVKMSYQNDNTVPEGQVINQSVAADTELEEGSDVVLTISSGKPTIKMKNVVGMTLSEAKKTLEGQGFVVKSEEQYSSSVAAGKVITQTPPAGSGLFEGTQVLVYVSKGKAPVPVTGVSVNKTSVALLTGATEQLTATVAPSNADSKNVTWKSSNTAVATVSASGLVKAVSAGSATITVTTVDGGKTAQIKVTVSNPTVKVTFNLNGGSGSNVTTTLRLNEPYGSLTNPTRDYYNFKGWFTAPTGGTRVNQFTVVTNSSAHSVYAQWELKPLSGWVLASSAPSGAQIVNRKWTYTKTETQESTNSSISGWTQTGSYWKQTGTGSAHYATFPDGYSTSDKYYTGFMRLPYSAYDNGSTKREVSNAWAGYIYWHWMYNCNSAKGTSTRAIYHKYGYGPDNGFLYKYFGAFTSTNGNYSSDKFYCNSQSITNYIIPERTAYADCQGSTRWFRFTYYTSTYTDYQKIYQFKKVTTGLESTTQVTASSTISDVKAYVQYREK